MSLLATLSLVTTGCGYNQIQTMDERVSQAKGQIETQLQRRADLVPNLVETVKGVARQESTVFISIAESRARLSGGPVGRRRQWPTNGLTRAWAGSSPSWRTARALERTSVPSGPAEGTEPHRGRASAYNTQWEYNGYIGGSPTTSAKIFGQGPQEYFEAAPGAKAR
jgi:LemA protein